MAIPAGTRLGPYEILAAIGAGGMGEVYRAKDTRLDRTVAIKTLRPHLADDPELRDRFEREARIIAKLNHPHVCVLYDIGREGDAEYLVMEYLEGETLAARLRNGPLPLEQVLAYASQLAGALAAAHSQGVTHRDLKPGNVMIGKSGVKVLDFGLARFQPNPDDTLTQGHHVMGTPAYMAPEQVLGRDCDARTDIYALGLIFYEMTSAKRAIPGQMPQLGFLPEKLAHIIERCLARDPDERWQSAKDVNAELAWAAKAPSPAESKPEPQARRPLFFYAAGALLLAGAVAACSWVGFQYRGRSTSGGSLSPDASLMTIASYTGTEKSGAISPDGKFFAFVSERGGPPDIWVRQISGGEPVQITHDAIREQDLVYAWDGESIYYSTIDAVPTIMKVGVLGGTPQKVVAGGRWPAPSPDGRRLAYGSISTEVAYGDALVVADVDGSHPRTITDSHEARVQYMSWSPDGKWIAFAGNRGIFSPYTISITDPDGRQKKNIAEYGLGIVYGTSWTGDSRQVVYAYDSAAGSGGSLGTQADFWMKPIDGGPGRRLTINPGGGFRSVRASRDGKRIVGQLDDVDYEVWRVPLKGDPETNAAAASRILDAGWEPFWTQLGPAGTLLFNSPATGERNLWTMPLDASATPRQITFLPGSHITHASLSPDRSRVAFVSVTAGNGQIWTANADGSGLRQLTNDASAKVWPFWSPDGKWIMFAVLSTEATQLWKVPSEGGKAEQFTKAGGLRGDWSPTGDRIVYDMNNGLVRIADASSGKVLREIAVKGVNLTSPIWSPDGNLISMHAPAAVWTVEPNSGEPRVAIQFPAGYVYNFRPAWMPDGKSIVVNKQVSTSRVVLLQNF